jgi:hypothetical protein
VRIAFDPHSGLEHPGKGHYPQCLVSTVYDVFRRLPIARTIQPMAEANEREEVKALLPQIPHGGVLLFDRGYPSYDLLAHLQQQYQGYCQLKSDWADFLPRASNMNAEQSMSYEFVYCLIFCQIHLT